MLSLKKFFCFLALLASLFGQKVLAFGSEPFLRSEPRFEPSLGFEPVATSIMSTAHENSSAAAALPAPSRISCHSVQLGYIYNHIYSDYLGILPYSGHQVAFFYDGSAKMSVQAHRSGNTHKGGSTPKGNKSGNAPAAHLENTWRLDLYGGEMLSPAKTRRHYSLSANLAYGIKSAVFEQNNFEIKTGGEIENDFRIFYLPAYGNNCVQIGIDLLLAYKLELSYALNLAKLPIKFSYQFSLPVLGCGFYPDFGISYYELSQSFSLNQIGFISLHNYWSFRNMFSVDLFFKNSCLRLSYYGKALWTKQNGIYQEWVANGVEIGFFIKIQNRSGR